MDPSRTPQTPRQAVVTLDGGNLNLRGAPTVDAPVLAQLPNGSAVQILGEFNDWYSVESDGIYGYAARQYVTAL